MSRYLITCEVEPQFVPEQSDPDAPLFLFAYTITLRNDGEVAAQVVARHWDIEDAHGQTQSVDGLGVVGHQPVLQPGQAFRYTSSVPLRTPMGLMSGHYFCVAVDGHRFEAPVPAFVLRAEGHAGFSTLH